MEEWIASAFAKELRRTSRRFAPRNDGKHTFATPRCDAPESSMNFLPHEKSEGAGKAGCPWHPQSCAENAHGRPQVPRKHPAFPARWVDGLFRALPGDEFVLSPSSA